MDSQFKPITWSSSIGGSWKDQIQNLVELSKNNNVHFISLTLPFGLYLYDGFVKESCLLDKPEPIAEFDSMRFTVEKLVDGELSYCFEQVLPTYDGSFIDKKLGFDYFALKGRRLIVKCIVVVNSAKAIESSIDKMVIECNNLYYLHCNSLDLSNLRLDKNGKLIYPKKYQFKTKNSSRNLRKLIISRKRKKKNK